MSWVQVSRLHSIYVKEYGNPWGIPVLVVHGGPGAGCNPSYLDYFDLEAFRVVFVDQRGAGKSIPLGELRENTIHDLVEDFERVRDLLHISTWHVLGGSWGTTLSIYYASIYPDSVLSLTLRAVCFWDQKSLEWPFYTSRYTFPEAFRAFTKGIPKNIIDTKQIVPYYYYLFTETDCPIGDPIYAQWNDYECACIDIPQEPATPGEAYAMARLECHYFMPKHQFDLAPHLRVLRNIPTFIIHGRYDTLTPVANAHKALELLGPLAQLDIVEWEGHSGHGPRVKRSIQQAMQRIQQRGTPLIPFNSQK